MGQLFVEEHIPLGCISKTLSRKPCLVNRLFFFLILQVTEKMELSGIQQLGKRYYSDTMMPYEKSFQLLLLLYSKIIERKLVRKGVRKGCSISCCGISQSLPGIRLWDFFCAQGLFMEHFLPAFELSVQMVTRIFIQIHSSVLSCSTQKMTICSCGSS